MPKLKTAIIGAGGHAQGHFKMVNDEPENDATMRSHRNESQGIYDINLTCPLPSCCDCRMPIIIPTTT